MDNIEVSATNLHTRFEAYIKAGHLRKTPERFAILDRLIKLQAHFDVDEVYNAMESDGYHVSRATVYNTVQLLCDCGILREIHLGGNSARYELDRGNHFHLVCNNCGKIKEIEDFGTLQQTVSRNSPGFIPAYYSICVYGLCAACSRKIKRKQKSTKQ